MFRWLGSRLFRVVQWLSKTNGSFRPVAAADDRQLPNSCNQWATPGVSCCMLVDVFASLAIAARSTLKDRLIADALRAGMTPQSVDALVALVPESMQHAGAFLDKHTGLWRYEYGKPYQLGEEFLFGTHMWLPVTHLRLALEAARNWVPPTKLQAFLTRLSDKSKHWLVLAEMMPVVRLTETATADFEVVGLGRGATDVDWLFTVGARRVALDVKGRHADLLLQAARKHESGFMPEPDHDPSLLFRSLTKKFRQADPDQLLQGAWITTHIQQHDEKLRMAFKSLPDSIHFAVLGDWEPDIFVIARREQDVRFLLDTFGAIQSARFTCIG